MAIVGKSRLKKDAFIICQVHTFPCVSSTSVIPFAPIAPFRHLCLAPFPPHRFLLFQLESPAGLYVAGWVAKVDKRHKLVHMSMESGYGCREFTDKNGKVIG